MQLVTDFRYAWRMIRKTPAASAIAVVSLALGIGANTAIFTLVNTVLLKLLPVKAPEDLYLVESRPRHLRTSWNYPDYRAMRDHNTVFEGLAGYSLGLQTMGVQLGDAAAQASELAYGSLVSGNYFEVLGVSPAVGRVFDSSDDRAPGAAPYVVLSYTYWQRRFHRESAVIGRKLRLNGYPFTVIGVAPPGFTGADVALKPDLFLPIMMRGQITHDSFERWNNRHNWWMAAIGRLKAGEPIKKAEAQLFAICKDQEAAERRSTPDPRHVNTAEQTVLVPGGRGYSWIADELRKPLWVLFAIVALVLLIACANVANLMLARGATRQREIAVRLAVGAGRWRVASQLLTESLLIACAGGAAGVVVSLLGVRLLLRFAPQPAWTPVTIHASPDWRVLAFTIAVSFATGLLFGVAPALRSSNPDLVSALKEDVPGSTGIHRFGLRKTLVVVQVALSLLLLIGASLFVRTLGSLRSLDTGFARENVIIATVDPARFGYKGQRLRDFYERLRARLAVSPGVRSASLANITPLSGSSWNSNVAIEGYAWKPGEKKYVWFDAVDPRYFETLGTSVRLGREFREQDNPATTIELPEHPVPGQEAPQPPGPRAAVVNEAFVRHFFAGRPALGMHVAMGETYRADKLFEIVGVVKDARYFSMRDAVEPMMFIPIWRMPAIGCAVVIRTTDARPQIAATLRREIAALDPTVPLLNVRTLEQDVDQVILVERLVGTLSAFFAVLALALSALGLYGVISFGVTRRTREIGIRVALGADRGSVLWLVFRDAVKMILLGAAIGIAGALAATRAVEGLLYGVKAQDPLSIAAAAVILTAAAVAATLIPARRATRVEPMVALRYE